MESRIIVTCIGLTLICLITHSSAQQLPHIACPQYFEYLSFNRQFIGHITIEHDPLSEVNNLVVEFSQYGAYDWSYVGSLSLWDDQATTTSNIRNGDPINYRVDFPIPQSPPKLTQIRLNNVVLCSAPQFGRPRTAISLTHTLRSTAAPLAFVSNPRRPANWFQPNWQENQTVFNIQPQEDTTPRVQPIQRVQPAQPIQRVQPIQPIQRVQPTQPIQQSQFQPEPEYNNDVEPKNSQPVSEICGRERVTTTPLIFRGKPLERGQLPWLVGLFERNQDYALIFFCGGTLISASTVLSAAHCFRIPGRDLPASSAVVSLGRNTIDLVSEGELRDVSQLLIHDQYKPSEYTQADLVLVRLASPVTFNDYIVPICLWSESFPLQLPSGYKAYVAGWGADEIGNVNTKLSKITDTDIVTESNCLRELPARLVQSKSLCAKKSGAGPCASDGGGGLMLRENNVWLLRAVLSVGQRKENTCDLSKPAVYTDVAKHIDWVRRNMWE